jgi:hypothetical protein
MKFTALVLAISASVVITLALPRMVTAQEGGAGIVEEIRGKAFWRQGGNAREERLDPRSDTARRLYPGEQVRCERGCRLQLRLGRTLKVVRPSAWFTIPALDSARPGPVQTMLNDYGRRGGRDRGEPLQVFSPSAHSVAMPELFIIRWVPDPAGCTLSLIVQDVEGKKVWQQDDVDASKGSLNSVAAKQALVDYRAKYGQGPLDLRLVDSCGGSEARLSFSLLSRESDQSLKNELTFWDKGDGRLMYHLGRASIFSRYRIFPQAAEEYEAALNAAPNSHDLLVRTILAHHMTGNFNREEELNKRLLTITNVP